MLLLNLKQRNISLITLRYIFPSILHLSFDYPELSTEKLLIEWQNQINSQIAAGFFGKEYAIKYKQWISKGGRIDEFLENCPIDEIDEEFLIFSF